MKANELPEKIYIHPDNDVMGEVLSQKVKGDVEYTRTDAFLEKAVNYIRNSVQDITYSYVDNIEHYEIDEFIEDFRNYMKGE